MKEQAWLIDVLFWSSSWQAVAALHYTALREEHNKAAFTVRTRNKTQCDWFRHWLTPTAISSIYERALDICFYIRNRLGFQAKLTVSWLVGLGHIDLCVPDNIRPKLTTDNSYFYDNVTVSHQCSWAVICKKAENPGCSLYFCCCFFSNLQCYVSI